MQVQIIITTMKSFKSVLLLFCMLVLMTQQSLAKESYLYGEEVVFKRGKVFLNLGVYNSGNNDAVPAHIFTVILKSSKDNIPFPRTSKLVVKFSNDSIIELTSFGEVMKGSVISSGNVERSDYDLDYEGRHYNPLDDGYFSPAPTMIKTTHFFARNYLLSEDDLMKILRWPIVELKVEQSNREIKTYKVGKRKSKKIFKKLQKSWQVLSLGK